MVLDRDARRPLAGMLVGLGLVGALVPVLTLWQGARGPLGPSIPLLFLAPVLLAATVGSRRAGVLVAIAAIAAWNWYFIPPLYTVNITSPRDVVALFVFLAVALLVGQLSTAVRRRAEEAVQRARGAEALYQLSVALSGCTDQAAALEDLTRRLRETFDLEACAVLLPATEGAWHTAAVAGSMPPELRADERRGVAATVTWAAAHGQIATLSPSGVAPGAGTGRTPSPRRRSGRAHFVPLRAGERPMGVLELIYRAPAPFDAAHDRLLATFVNGAALALEQERLAAEERAAAVARDSDRLKGAILSSLSHDLRTPLAAIKAASSSLLQPDVAWGAEERQAFIADIDAEADRLTRLVSNLLDLSRLQAGALAPAREWEDVGELLERVVRRLGPQLGAHAVALDVPAPDALPAVRLDAVQIEQALANLLENAAKYAPPGTPIRVGARLAAAAGRRAALRLWVADRGPGIPPSEQDRIFEPFYRGADLSRMTRGTGLGLAIVKGLVEAHGGRVAVMPTPSGGATFTLTLPVECAGDGDPDALERPVARAASR